MADPSTPLPPSRYAAGQALWWRGEATGGDLLEGEIVTVDGPIVHGPGTAAATLTVRATGGAEWFMAVDWVTGASTRPGWATIWTEPPSAEPPGPGEQGPLTDVEHLVMRLLSDVWDRLVCDVVGHGPTRDDDLREIAGHVHGLQNLVLAQAAARCYPDRYRALGHVLTRVAVDG